MGNRAWLDATGRVAVRESRGTAARASSSGSWAGKQEPRWETLTDLLPEFQPRRGR